MIECTCEWCEVPYKLPEGFYSAIKLLICPDCNETLKQLIKDKKIEV